MIFDNFQKYHNFRGFERFCKKIEIIFLYFVKFQILNRFLMKFELEALKAKVFIIWSRSRPWRFYLQIVRLVAIIV